jgi:tetratricopeptide (TPR) repeat protein
MSLNCFHKKKLDSAMDLIKEAKHLNPTDDRIHIMMGFIYISQDKMKEALESFSEAYDYSETDDDRRNAKLLYSRSARCLGMMDKAMEALDYLVKIFPDDALVNYEMAALMAELLKPDSSGLRQQLSPHQS